jgi:hypothetical protein
MDVEIVGAVLGDEEQRLLAALGLAGETIAGAGRVAAAATADADFRKSRRFIESLRSGPLGSVSLSANVVPARRGGWSHPLSL